MNDQISRLTTLTTEDFSVMACEATRQKRYNLAAGLFFFAAGLSFGEGSKEFRQMIYQMHKTLPPPVEHDECEEVYPRNVEPVPDLIEEKDRVNKQLEKDGVFTGD